MFFYIVFLGGRVSILKFDYFCKVGRLFREFKGIWVVGCKLSVIGILL